MKGRKRRNHTRAISQHLQPCDDDFLTFNF